MQVKVNNKDLAIFGRFKPTCQSHNPVYHPEYIQMQALSSNGWGQRNRESLWSSWFPQGWTQEAYIREKSFLESPVQDFSLNNEHIYWWLFQIYRDSGRPAAMLLWRMIVRITSG